MAEKMRKITLEVPADLLERAQRASGGGVTQTVRDGLQILAAKDAYEGLLKLRGTLSKDVSWQDLKYDR